MSGLTIHWPRAGTCSRRKRLRSVEKERPGKQRRLPHCLLGRRGVGGGSRQKGIPPTKPEGREKWKRWRRPAESRELLTPGFGVSRGRWRWPRAENVAHLASVGRGALVSLLSITSMSCAQGVGTPGGRRPRRAANGCHHWRRSHRRGQCSGPLQVSVQQRHGVDGWEVSLRLSRSATFKDNGICCAGHGTGSSVL